MAYCAEHCYDHLCIGGVGPAIEKNKEFYRAAGMMDEYFKGIDESRDRLRNAMIKRNEADERARKEIEDRRKKGIIRKLGKTKNGFELNGQEISLPPIFTEFKIHFYDENFPYRGPKLQELVVLTEIEKVCSSIEADFYDYDSSPKREEIEVWGRSVRYKQIGKFGHYELNVRFYKTRLKMLLNSS